MDLLQLKFRRVLNRENSFGIVDEGRQRVQGCCLTRAGPAGHDHVQACGHCCLQISGHLFGKRPKIDEVVDAELIFFELTNGNQRPVDGNRRHHSIEARSILKARIDIRVGFIHATPNGGNNLVNDPQKVLFVFECRVRQLKLTIALDENLLRAVDQDIADRIILKERLQRAKPVTSS